MIQPCCYNRIQELNNRLSRTLSSEEMRQVIKKEVASVKEEKASQSATASMTVLQCVGSLLSVTIYYSGAQTEPPPKPKVRENKTSITQWNQEQLQLLVKGVNLYPPGTGDRLGIYLLLYLL